MNSFKYLTTGFLILFSLLLVKGQSPQPYGALPSPQQLEWAQMNYYAFIHFNMNTFTDKEWGDGNESPDTFNPTNLDCRQWARIVKAAGMKGIILTAKHHDGFCLWPSKYSTHTVKESKWRDGKGDVLRELSEACCEYGLKLGIYISAWDRNHPSYGSSEYIEVFNKTLEEVLTNYGDIFEVWFDGGCGEGSNGQSAVCDFGQWNLTVNRYQPRAIVFGNTCRWVGNESGYSSPTSWCTWGHNGKIDNLNIFALGDEDGSKWAQAEADVSLHPGWFYKKSEENQVKTLDQLVNIYYGSIGQNANLLLSIPVDNKGLVHPNDSAALIRLKKYLDVAFSRDLAKGKKVTASATRKSDHQAKPSNITDGNYKTYWTTNDNESTSWFEVDFGKQTDVNCILLQEQLEFGQRVKKFTIEAETGKNYTLLAEGTTIGYKRILRFPTVKVQKVRVKIIESKACPVIGNFEAYKVPQLLSDLVVTRDKSGKVSIRTETENTNIYYTTDNSEPTVKSKKYNQAFDFKRGGIIKAKAIMRDNSLEGNTINKRYDLAPDKWSVIDVENAKDRIEAEKAIDGNSVTSWLTKSGNGNPPQHYISINLGELVQLKGFSYFPCKDTSVNGTIYKYDFYTSLDGKEWHLSKSGEFSNIQANPIEQKVLFDKVVEARFIKLKAREGAFSENTGITIGEVGAITNDQ
jgi:alpha-L-fucosidase